jgi:hypothetical protein
MNDVNHCAAVAGAGEGPTHRQPVISIWLAVALELWSVVLQGTAQQSVGVQSLLEYSKAHIIISNSRVTAFLCHQQLVPHRGARHTSTSELL